MLENISGLLVGFVIITFILLFLKKQWWQQHGKLVGISLGVLLVSVSLIGCSIIDKSINLDPVGEVELTTTEAHEVTIELEDWNEPATLYIGEVWQDANESELQSDVKTLDVTKADIANEAITFSNSLASNEVRKLITVTMDKADAEEFVEATINSVEASPVEEDTFEDYLQAPVDTKIYISYLNADTREQYVIAEQAMIELAEAEAEQAAKDKAAEKAEAEKKAIAAAKKAEEESKKLSGLKVHFIDVGQADAALIQYDGHAILIDSGDWNRNETVTYLQDQGIEKIDLMVGSHPHADHIGQMDKVIENFDVEEVWMSGGLATTQVFERVITAIDNNNIGYDEPRAGDTYQIGDLKIDILSPTSLTGNLNDDSIVMKLTYGEISFLFTGDAETPAESKMVSSGQDLSATILKAGHHGSDTSTTQSFLDKVKPKVAIISVAEKSKYDHPDKSVIDRINAGNINLLATKTHGNIVISTDGVDYEVSTGSSGSVTAGKSAEKPAKQAASKPKATKTETKEKAPAKDNCIDINEASEAALQDIKHIGPATAPKVIAARPFASVHELTTVSGIKEKKIADIISEGKACVK